MGKLLIDTPVLCSAVVSYLIMITMKTVNIYTVGDLLMRMVVVLSMLAGGSDVRLEFAAFCVSAAFFE